MLRNLGIHHGQRYLLCWPTSIDLIPKGPPEELWLASIEATTKKAS